MPGIMTKQLRLKLIFSREIHSTSTTPTTKLYTNDTNKLNTNQKSGTLIIADMFSARLAFGQPQSHNSPEPTGSIDHAALDKDDPTLNIKCTLISIPCVIFVMISQQL